MKKGLIALAATIVAMAAVLGSCSTQKKGGVQTSGGMLPENMQMAVEQRRIVIRLLSISRRQ